MDSRRPFRRLLLPTALALGLITTALGAALAAESDTDAGAQPRVTTGVPVGARALGGVQLGGVPLGAAVWRAEPASTHPADKLTLFRGGVPAWIGTRPAHDAAAPAVKTQKPTARPTRAAASTPPASKPTVARAASYSGRNHVWIPSLGVSRSVAFFPCSRTTPPGHQIYLWGCAGANNVYLLGHAESVMRPLYNAYVTHRLRKGMKVIYGDSRGRVRTYAVTFWKVVSPVNAGWAFAAQSRPSMTLQTCVGANSQYRLVVRLVAVG